MALIRAMPSQSLWVACVSLGGGGVGGAGASRGAYEKTREVCMGKGAWVDVQDGGVREAVRTVNALRLHVLIDVQGYGVCNAHATTSRCTSV